MDKRGDQFGEERNIFSVRVLSAIGQPIPRMPFLWSREKLVFFEEPEQRSLPLS